MLWASWPLCELDLSTVSPSRIFHICSMLCKTQSIECTVIATLSYILLVTAQNSTFQASLRQDIECQLAKLYQQPNASNVYQIPATDVLANEAPGVTLANNSTQKWVMTTILGQASNPYVADHTPILEQAIFLDTSSTLPNPSSAPNIGIGGCKMIFGISSSGRGRDEDGSCTSVFDKECVSDLKAQALVEAQSIARNTTRPLTPLEACRQISLAISNWPKSCSEYREKDSSILKQFSGKNATIDRSRNIQPHLKRSL